MGPTLPVKLLIINYLWVSSLTTNRAAMIDTSKEIRFLSIPINRSSDHARAGDTG